MSDDAYKLEKMWDDQVQFMKLLQQERGFPDFPTDITSKKGQQFLEGICFHMVKEAFESLAHLRNSKSHRLTEIKDVDREAFVEELVDVQHLLHEMCIAAGISLDEFYDAYMKKGSTNRDRILHGY